MSDLETFRADVSAWLRANTQHAPRNYGAIVPPELVEEGMAWQRRLYDAGMTGFHWPPEHGGKGLSAAHTGVWLEEAALADVPPFLNMVSIVLMGETVMAHGTDEQKADHLHRTLRGERVWCQLFSEPGAGSDLASLATRAERDRDEWVLNGQKVWCSNGRVADYGICLARTDADAPKHKGISFFLVDMQIPGIELRPIRQMTGGSEFDEVFFTDARIPADALLGPLHGGWGVAMGTLTNERGHIGASVISLGRRVADLTDVSLYARGRALQALGQRQGPQATTAASLLKLGITELFFDIAVARADEAGAHAMLDGDAALGVLGAPGGRIAGGSSQVQRNIIGEMLLGLPKEPRI
ncbi:MAG TPA: acyl-CoA dehydrogenase family protein [Acidimicrobiales bacterium]|nr:acyl-CoA dehydrogenase family protein [Acidimicrobiales bacterium]